MTDPTAAPSFRPDKSTPLTLDEALTAFAGGYQRTMGARPSGPCLAALVAQSALETGNWGPGKIHWFNFGNVKRGSWEGLWTAYRCNEVLDGHVQWFDPPHPQTWFRAFSTADEGAAAQVLFLAMTDRYRQAWHHALAGAYEAFVRALCSAGYFTGPVDSYVRAVVSIANKIAPACTRLVGGEPHGLTDDERDHVGLLVALSLADEARNIDQEAETDPAPPPDEVA